MGSERRCNHWGFSPSDERFYLLNGGPVDFNRVEAHEIGTERVVLFRDLDLP